MRNTVHCVLLNLRNISQTCVIHSCCVESSGSIISVHRVLLSCYIFCIISMNEWIMNKQMGGWPKQLCCATVFYNLFDCILLLIHWMNCLCDPEEKRLFFWATIYIQRSYIFHSLVFSMWSKYFAKTCSSKQPSTVVLSFLQENQKYGANYYFNSTAIQFCLWYPGSNLITACVLLEIKK